MPIEENLDKVARTILITLLRIYNYTHAFCILVWSHTTRVYKAIKNEYTNEFYYFFENSLIPYKSRGALDPNEITNVDWIYDVTTKQYISGKERTVANPDASHKFNFICIDVKKQGNVDCVVGFFKDISWKGSDLPPNPSLLLRTYGLENGVLIDLEGLELEIITNRGNQVTIPVSEEGLGAWTRLFQDEH